MSKDRTNHHRLKPSLVSTNYESSEIMTRLALPRKYTWVAHHLSIGNEYNAKLIEKVVKDETQIIGKWVESNDHPGKYEIHFEVLLTTDRNNNLAIRNKYFSEKLSLVLEEIAFSETALLKSRPSLAGTKIYVNFRTHNNGGRNEYWHRLGHWTQESMREASSMPEKRSEYHKKSSHTKKKHYDRHPPQMCRQCQKK